MFFQDGLMRFVGFLMRLDGARRCGKQCANVTGFDGGRDCWVEKRCSMLQLARFSWQSANKHRTRGPNWSYGSLRHLATVPFLSITRLGQLHPQGHVAVPQLESTVPHRNSKQLAHLPRPIKEDNYPNLEHRRVFGWYHISALGLTERWLSCRSNALPRPGAYRRPNITKLHGKVPNHFSASTVWRRLWEAIRIYLQFLKNTWEPLQYQRSYRRMDYRTTCQVEQASRCTLALPSGNPPVIQTTVEAELLAQMTSLRKEMAKLQEHNHLLSSKVDETQRLLNQQETQNIQATEPSQSLQTPGRQKKGKKRAKAMPVPSKQVVVPAPRDQPHVPKKVYTNCRHRIKDKDAERQRSPIRINARLRDSRMRVLGSKSPLRKVRGLVSEVESDDEYAPSKGTKSNYRSETPTEYSKARPPSPRRSQAEISLSVCSSREFRRWKTTELGPRNLTGENFCRDPLPSASRSPDRTGRYSRCVYHFTPAWKTP
ncbi:unnamed protein product [Prunus armeniaca]